MLKVFIASDHAGVEVKELLLQHFAQDNSLELIDLGPRTKDSSHYPEFARKVVEAMARHPQSRGILLCGTGIGMSMVANKFQGIRAALCTSPNHAQMARLHNDSNVLCLGVRTSAIADIIEMVKVWGDTQFSGDRHAQRLTLFANLGSEVE